MGLGGFDFDQDLMLQFFWGGEIKEMVRERQQKQLVAKDGLHDIDHFALLFRVAVDLKRHDDGVWRHVKRAIVDCTDAVEEWHRCRARVSMSDTWIAVGSIPTVDLDTSTATA